MSPPLGRSGARGVAFRPASAPLIRVLCEFASAESGESRNADKLTAVQQPRRDPLPHFRESLPHLLLVFVLARNLRVRWSRAAQVRHWHDDLRLLLLLRRWPSRAGYQSTLDSLMPICQGRGRRMRGRAARQGGPAAARASANRTLVFAGMAVSIRRGLGRPFGVPERRPIHLQTRPARSRCLRGVSIDGFDFAALLHATAKAPCGHRFRTRTPSKTRV